jgi:hypothetical protein
MGQFNRFCFELIRVLPGLPGLIVSRHLWTPVEVSVQAGEVHSPVATLVIQSHRQPLPYAWLAPCVDSVKSWAKSQGFDYQFLGDELFELLPRWLLDKTQSQRVIATDLARIKWMQKFLLEGYERVVWLDADFLIFAPDEFHLAACNDLPENYALGREVWVQPKEQNPKEQSLKRQSKEAAKKFKVNTKVHNAFLLFGKGNSFLDFYAAHAERLLEKITGTMPPQFIGPKLLTALHNVVQCPVQENAGMLSPWVIRDLLNDEGPALTLFRAKSPLPPAGANLCASLSGSHVFKDPALKDRVLLDVVERLLSRGSI